MSPITYFLWPNPGHLPYSNPKIMLLLSIAFALLFAFFLLRWWRRRLMDTVMKRLSRSWPAAALWFGMSALLLAVARAEQISYVSMRLWWIVWAAALVVYIIFQVRIFRARYYEKLPRSDTTDPRAKYLPRKKKARR